MPFVLELVDAEYANNVLFLKNAVFQKKLYQAWKVMASLSPRFARMQICLTIMAKEQLHILRVFFFDEEGVL